MPAELTGRILILAISIDVFPLGDPAYNWTSSCGCYDHRTYFSKNHQGTLKKMLLTHKSWRIYCATKGHSEVMEEKRELRAWALPLLGSESEVSLEFLGFTTCWLIESIRAGIIAQEGRSGVIQRDNSINYLDYLGLSKRGSPWVGQSGPLSGWFVSINNCVIELAMCLFRMDIF